MVKILKYMICCILLMGCDNDEENIINGNSDYKFPFELMITGESNSVSTIPFDVNIQPILTGDVPNPNPGYKYKFSINEAQVRNGDVLLTPDTWLNYDDLMNGIVTITFTSTNSTTPKTITVTMKNNQGFETTQTKSFGVSNLDLDFSISIMDTNNNSFTGNVIPFEFRESTVIKVENLVPANPITSLKFQSNAILSVNGTPITTSTEIPYGNGVFSIQYKPDSYGTQPINVIASDQQNTEVTKGIIIDLKYKIFDANITWGTGVSNATSTSNLIEFYVSGNWNSSPFHFTSTGSRTDKYIKISIQKYDPAETYHLEFVQNPATLLTYGGGSTTGDPFTAPLTTNWQGHYVLDEGISYVKLDANMGPQASTIWGSGSVTFKVVSSNGDEKTRAFNCNVYLNGSLN